MLEQFSPDLQFIIVIVILAVLFLSVFLNNKRNKRKHYDRKIETLEKTSTIKTKQKRRLKSYLS